jgi:hypothetical protein
VFVSFGTITAQIDNVASGFHSDQLVTFPDAFVSVTGQPNSTFFVAVSE